MAEFIENIILLLPWIFGVSIVLLVCGAIADSCFKDEERRKKSAHINKQFKAEMKIINTDPSEYYDVIDFDVERRRR